MVDDVIDQTIAFSGFNAKLNPQIQLYPILIKCLFMKPCILKKLWIFKAMVIANVEL